MVKSVLKPKTKLAVRETDHHKAQAALWGSSKPMAKAPNVFDPEGMYQVQLSRSVPADDSVAGHMLRPSARVIVSGAFAETIRDAIVAVVKVG